MSSNEIYIEIAMDSIITFFTATRATNYIVNGIEEYTVKNFISSQQEEIKVSWSMNWQKVLLSIKEKEAICPEALKAVLIARSLLPSLPGSR